MIIQLLLMIALAPLVSGIITKIKNNLRMRRGPGIFQPYYALAKYFLKDETVSEHASWIFEAAPYIVFSATAAAAFLVPAVYRGGAGYIGDFLAVVFLLSLGKFFLSLAGLDPASAFGGMGSSREMFISSFAEPAILLSIFGISLSAGTTNLAVLFNGHAMTLPVLLAVSALFLILLAETSRIPVDNQETHLELTMIHEAMVLEYSGRSLALIELSSYLKQMIFFSLVACLLCVNLIWLPVYYLAIAVTVALVELSLAKMRLFRAVDYIAFSAILAMIAIIAGALKL